MATQPSLLRSVGSISFATFLSRILGLARDQVQAYYFGAGVVTDAFYAAFRIPNLLRDLFAEGALSAAFVPTFTAERQREGDAAALRLGLRVLTALCVVLGAVTVGIALGARGILELYAPGFDGEKLRLAVAMTRILSPFLLLVALAAVAMGMLNTYGRYFLPAVAPAFFNVAAILGVVSLSPLLRSRGMSPGLSLAWGALAGGALQFLVQVPALRRAGLRFRWDFDVSDPGLRRVARLMAPASFGLAATQVNILVDTMLASSFGDGPITWLAYAFRLMQLPIGLFGVAIATANLVRVSHDAAVGDRAGLRSNLAASLRAAAVLTLPATAGLVALREPIVRVLFERGEFRPDDTAATAAATLCYAAGLYAYAVTKIQVPTFYALGETRVPVAASASAVAVKVAANFVFIWLFPRLGLPPFLGLAASTSLAAWVNLGLLSAALRRRLGSLRGTGAAAAALRVGALSAVMGGGCGAFHGALERWVPGNGIAGDLGRLVVVVFAGAVFALEGARWLGVPEARALGERVRAFASRRSPR